MSVIHIDSAVRSRWMTDFSDRSMLMTEFSFTYMIWSYVTLGFFLTVSSFIFTLSHFSAVPVTPRKHHFSNRHDLTRLFDTFYASDIKMCFFETKKIIYAEKKIMLPLICRQEEIAAKFETYLKIRYTVQ
jgi:hypothetical protein